MGIDVKKLVNRIKLVNENFVEFQKFTCERTYQDFEINHRFVHQDGKEYSTFIMYGQTQLTTFQMIQRDFYNLIEFEYRKYQPIDEYFTQIYFEMSSLFFSEFQEQQIRIKIKGNTTDYSD